GLFRAHRGGQHGVQVVCEVAEGVLPARGDFTAAVSALVVGDHPEFGAELVDLVPPKPQCAQHSVGEHDGRGVRATAYFDVQAGAIAAANRAHLDRHARSGWDFVFCWFRVPASPGGSTRSEEHTSELQSRENLVCRLLLEKKKRIRT